MHGEMAFPLAALSLGLWRDFAEVGEAIMVHLYNECPALIPYYPIDEQQVAGEAKYDCL